MKLFKFRFRKLEEEETVIEDAIETWVVEWKSFYRHTGASSYGSEKKLQSFISKESAELYAEELRDARRILGDSSFGDEKLRGIKVYKQIPPTNIKKEK